MNYIHWDQTRIIEALVGFFAKSPKPAIPVNGTIYKIEEAFKGFDYWIHKATVDRFDATMEHGILYRGDIVNELVEKVDKALNSELERGVLVAGPHGIGKSHSLVNLVPALQQRGELVTFIPDCGSWNYPRFILNMICGSIDTTMENLVGGGSGSMPVTEGDLFEFVRIVTSILGELDKRWVFVFDQVNVLFSMNRATKFAGLCALHQMISNGRSLDRVVPVMAATTDNEMVDDFSCYIKYEHKIELNETELKVLFPVLVEDESLAQEVQEIAGCHPYYVSIYLKDPNSFHDKVYRDVYYSVQSLKRNSIKDMVMESIVLCVLQKRRSHRYSYDQNFMVIRYHPTGHGVMFHPLMPTVVAAYRCYYWNEIMVYVLDQERSLLHAAARRDLTPNVRDGWLTAAVIGRIFAKGLAYTWDNQTISSDNCHPVVNFSGSITIEAGCVRHFPGLKLPNTFIYQNALYVPDNPNFPSIDFFVRCGNLVVAFAVHTSGHENVGPIFWDTCRRAGWLPHDGNDKTMDLDLTILLVYLGPNKASQEAAIPHVAHGVIEGVRARSDPFSKHVYVTSMRLEQFQDSLSTIRYKGR